MIYDWVTTPSEARDCMVSFYEDVLRDEIADEHTLTSPAGYLAEVLSDAEGQVDGCGRDIEHLIRKACEQKSTLKELEKAYGYASREPQDYMEMYS